MVLLLLVCVDLLLRVLIFFLVGLPSEVAQVAKS